MCVLRMASCALPALASCLGSSRNPLGSGVPSCCAGPPVPCPSLGCGTGLIIPIFMSQECSLPGAKHVAAVLGIQKLSVDLSASPPHNLASICHP